MSWELRLYTDLNSLTILTVLIPRHHTHRHRWKTGIDTNLHTYRWIWESFSEKAVKKYFKHLNHKIWKNVLCKNETEVATDLFFSIVVYIWVKWQNVVQDVVLSVGCWFNGGGSECKLTVNCKKEFKQTKWLKKSGIRHHREICLFTSYDI